MQTKFTLMAGAASAVLLMSAGAALAGGPGAVIVGSREMDAD